MVKKLDNSKARDIQLTLFEAHTNSHWFLYSNGELDYDMPIVNFLYSSNK